MCKQHIKTEPPIPHSITKVNQSASNYPNPKTKTNKTITKTQ